VQELKGISATILEDKGLKVLMNKLVKTFANYILCEQESGASMDNDLGPSGLQQVSIYLFQASGICVILDIWCISV
jgi:hypothetical protein